MKDFDWGSAAVVGTVVIVAVLVISFLSYSEEFNNKKQAKQEALCLEICSSRSLSIKDCIKFIRNDCL